MLRSLITVALVGAANVYAQTAVSQTVFNNILRYTNFAGAAYSEECPKPPSGSSIVRFFNNTPTDTQATLYRDSAANEFILSFRGSATPRDLDTDFLFTLVPVSLTGVTGCTGCLVHQGFQEAYNSIAADVNSAVSSALSSTPSAKLVVTGHSLGGGLASLASASLAGHGRAISAVYTFGEPRNGNAAFSSYVNSKIPVANYFRVTHANDGVPTIPPTLLGYQHHGTEYWEKAASGVSAANTFQCSGTEPTSCSAAQNFGENPINGAHIAYTNVLLASALYNPTCGYVEPQ